VLYSLALVTHWNRRDKRREISANQAVTPLQSFWLRVTSGLFVYPDDCGYSRFEGRLEIEMMAAYFLGTALIMSSASWGADEYPKLVLRVYDFAGIRTSDLAGAVAETVRIYRAAGIELIWTEADPAEPAMVASVVVASIVSSGRPDFPVTVLGQALPFAVSGGRITLFLDNIRARAAEGALPFPVLLGHALAHELGHVLGAGARDHRFPGLMCAKWGPMEFDRMRHGALGFSHSQSVAMRHALTDRMRADSSGMVASGSDPCPDRDAKLFADSPRRFRFLDWRMK